MGGNNKRRKEKDKLKDANRLASESFVEFKYSSYVRSDQPKNSVVVRRLGTTGEFVKDHRVDRRVVRKGVAVKPEVLREAYIVQNFQFILRPESFYEANQQPMSSSQLSPTTTTAWWASSASAGVASTALQDAAGEERSALVAQGLMDDFPAQSRKAPHRILSEALASFGTKIHWSHIVALSTRLDVDDIKCPICLESPTAPRVTPCGHIFCFHCILRAMNAQRKLGLATSGTPSTPTANRAPSATNANALGSASEYGARPRTCPLCSSSIDLQGLRPCFIEPMEPLTDAVLSAQPIHSFSLSLRNVQSPVVVPASAAMCEDSLCAPESSNAVVAGTLYHQPNFIPTYGTQYASYSRYAFATSNLLKNLFQTELMDIERQLRELIGDRPDPSAPLDEGEEYQQNALQGVYRHLASYGFCTLITSGCEVQTVASTKQQKALMSAAIARGASEAILSQAFPSLASVGSSPTPLSVSNTPVFPSTPPQSRPPLPSSSSMPLLTGGHGMPPRQSSSANMTLQHQPSPQQQVAAAANASPIVWSYRLSDGQNVYLHPINVRMLLRQAEIDASKQGCNSTTAGGDSREDALLALAAHLPQTISVRILDMEHFTQPATKISKLFAHVPPHAAFLEAFVDLTQVVSNEVIMAYKPQIMDRLKELHRKKRKTEQEAAINDNDGGCGGSATHSGSKVSGGGLAGSSYRAASAAFLSSVASSSGDVAVLDSLQLYLEEGEETDEIGFDEEYEEDDYYEEDEDLGDYDVDAPAARKSAQMSTPTTTLTSAAVAEAAAAYGSISTEDAIHHVGSMGGRNNSAATHGSSSVSAAVAASWVDAHTTADDYAVYNQKQQEVLLHPDEVQTVHRPNKNGVNHKANNPKVSHQTRHQHDNHIHNAPQATAGGISYNAHDYEDGEDYDLDHEEEDGHHGMWVKHRHSGMGGLGAVSGSGGSGGRQTKKSFNSAAAANGSPQAKKGRQTTPVTEKAITKPSAAQSPPKEDMASIYAAVGDLTEEEQLWLQEEENAKKHSDEVTYETPQLDEQYGPTGHAHEDHGDHPPDSSATNSWKAKPKHFDSAVFPDLMGGGSSASTPPLTSAGWGSSAKLTPPIGPQNTEKTTEKFGSLPSADDWAIGKSKKKKK